MLLNKVQKIYLLQISKIQASLYELHYMVRRESYQNTVAGRKRDRLLYIEEPQFPRMPIAFRNTGVNATN